MDWLLSDLDNTLIYSYKRALGADKRLVETKDGKELSFMSGRSYELLPQVRKKYCFVPVTTRSLEQYRRIFLPGTAPPSFALAANGGILLRDGRLDEGWYEASSAICEKAEAELRQAERILAQDPDVSFEVRRVDGLFVFTKSQRQELTVDRLRRELSLQKVQVWNNGSKIYVLPQGLSKGAAVQRLRALSGTSRILAAGDSEFDISMLMEADEAWLPESLRSILHEYAEVSEPDCAKRLHIASEHELLSDVLLETLAKRSPQYIP